MADTSERLTKRGRELLTATFNTDAAGNPTNQHLAVVARLSREDGQLMLEAAAQLQRAAEPLPSPHP